MDSKGFESLGKVLLNNNISAKKKFGQGVPGRKKGEGENEGRGRRRRRCEGGKGPTQGKSLTRVAEGTRIPLYFDHLSKC